ncbi:MAG: RIP metalloprotease RseP [Atopostipes suicloacalis]|nr:RIP metalloprotease RseP [Atopostipes suicloacalis]
MQTLLAFIFVFGIIVIVHEFGHFYFAKKSGILVREFAIGMGPKIFQVHKNETTYTLRALPIGGYVMMAGYEDDEDLRLGMPALLVLDENENVKEIDLTNNTDRQVGIPVDIIDYDFNQELSIKGQLSSEEGDSVSYSVNEDAMILKEDGTKLQIAPANRQFQNAPLFRRILTNLGGPLNNFILAILAFTLLAFMQNGVPTNEAIIGNINTDSSAATTQIKSGDRVLEINDQEVNTWQEMALIIRDHPNEPIQLKVESEDESIYNLSLTPNSFTTEEGEEVGRIGIEVYRNNSFKDKVIFGFTNTWDLTVQISRSIVSLFTGGFSVDDLGGPVAIYNLTGEVAAAGGFFGIVNFLGFLSVNLGLMNLLPIPGLDGGKLVLNIVEGLRGKPLSEEKETVITLIGVVILLALMLFITWNDIQRFFF